MNIPAAQFSSTTSWDTWTLLADDENKIQAFETKCMRKLLRISYRVVVVVDLV